MMNDERWAELQQAEDMAYFKADLCCYSPESYSLEEKKEICNDMISTSKAVLDAMRADFEQLPPEARSKLRDMLCQSGVETPEWWWDVLVGEGNPSLPRIGAAGLESPSDVLFGVRFRPGPISLLRALLQPMSPAS